MPLTLGTLVSRLPKPMRAIAILTRAQNLEELNSLFLSSPVSEFPTEQPF